LTGDVNGWKGQVENDHAEDEPPTTIPQEMEWVARPPA
jgi:hypothetical protein